MEELTTKVINITPELAKEYLACNRMNRPVVQAAVDKYANLMLRGEWELNGEAICFAKGGALINGQHRLLAIIKANIPVQMFVVYGVEEDSFLTYDQGLTVPPLTSSLCRKYRMLRVFLLQFKSISA